MHLGALQISCHFLQQLYQSAQTFRVATGVKLLEGIANRFNFSHPGVGCEWTVSYHARTHLPSWHAWQQSLLLFYCSIYAATFNGRDHSLARVSIKNGQVNDIIHRFKGQSYLCQQH